MSSEPRIAETSASRCFLHRKSIASKWVKPGARVGIVDQERPTPEHSTPIELLRCELSAVGYRAIATYQLAGDGGYLAIFSPPDAASRKSPEDIVPCDDRAGAR